MNILFLDDNISRFQILFDNIKNAGISIQYVQSSQEAISDLQQNLHKYDYIFLDHDLGPSENDDKNNGQLVVNYLIANKERIKKNLTTIVHSYNPVAGFWMYADLVQAGFNTLYEPGVWIRISNQDNQLIIKQWIVE